MVNDELRKKLMAAATPGEIRVILEEAGLDSGEDTVDEIWRKHKPTETELSLWTTTSWRLLPAATGTIARMAAIQPQIPAGTGPAMHVIW